MTNQFEFKIFFFSYAYVCIVCIHMCMQVHLCMGVFRGQAIHVYLSPCVAGSPVLFILIIQSLAQALS